MGALKRVSFAILCSVVLLAAVYLGMRVFASWQTNYSLKEMDWNRDGRTTFSEFLKASDVGRRDIAQRGLACREYYSLKDGLTIRLDCTSRKVGL